MKMNCKRKKREFPQKPRAVNSKTDKAMCRIFFKFVFFFLSLLFAAVLITILTKHDFSLPSFTEHARELSKHRTSGEVVTFHFVSNIREFPHGEERLPKDLQPLSYKLDLRANLTTLRYRGMVTIKILCKKATRFVILHSGNLDILNVSMTTAGKRLAVERILAFKKNQQLCIEVEKTLRKGALYHVTLQFKSKISDRLEGFYKSSYTSETGEIRYELKDLLYLSVSTPAVIGESWRPYSTPQPRPLNLKAAA